MDWRMCLIQLQTHACLGQQLSGQLNKHPEEELEGEPTAAELHRALSFPDLTGGHCQCPYTPDTSQFPS